MYLVCQSIMRGPAACMLQNTSALTRLWHASQDEDDVVIVPRHRHSNRAPPRIGRSLRSSVVRQYGLCSLRLRPDD